MTRSFQLSGPRAIDGLLHLPEGSGSCPVVVVCHGFKGFMEWGFFPALADLLVARGFAVARFNFSGGGVRPGEDVVTDLTAFRETTITRELEDLRMVLDRLPTLSPRLDPERVGLLGHSRGGALAVLAAASRPAGLRALVTWSAIATFDRLGDEEVARWRERGEITVTNARTGQRLPLGLAQLEDYERHREAYDLEAAGAAVRAPWLIAHGDDDPTVPVAEGRRLAEAAHIPSRYLEVVGADHVFGAAHPFRGPTPALIQVFNATQSWFARWLRD